MDLLSIFNNVQAGVVFEAEPAGEEFGPETFERAVNYVIPDILYELDNRYLVVSPLYTAYHACVERVFSDNGCEGITLEMIDHWVAEYHRQAKEIADELGAV